MIRARKSKYIVEIRRGERTPLTSERTIYIIIHPITAEWQVCVMCIIVAFRSSSTGAASEGRSRSAGSGWGAAYELYIRVVTTTTTTMMSCTTKTTAMTTTTTTITTKTASTTTTRVLMECCTRFAAGSIYLFFLLFFFLCALADSAGLLANARSEKIYLYIYIFMYDGQSERAIIATTLLVSSCVHAVCMCAVEDLWFAVGRCLLYRHWMVNVTYGKKFGELICRISNDIYVRSVSAVFDFLLLCILISFFSLDTLYTSPNFDQVSF